MATRKLFSQTVDSDVVVLCIHHFPSLKIAGMTEFWTGFAKGKSYQVIPIHESPFLLGDDEGKALSFSHAYTGCLPSSFCGIGKKTAWATWERYPEITDTMTDDPSSIDDDEVQREKLKKWTMMMYSKSCSKVPR